MTITVACLIFGIQNSLVYLHEIGRKYLAGCPVGSCSPARSFIPVNDYSIQPGAGTLALNTPVQCWIRHGSHPTSVSGIDTGVWSGQVTSGRNKAMFMEQANEPLWNQEGENACIFSINKTEKVIKSLLWDLFIISCCSTMQPHCVNTHTPKEGMPRVGAHRVLSSGFLLPPGHTCHFSL